MVEGGLLGDQRPDVVAPSASTSATSTDTNPGTSGPTLRFNTGGTEIVLDAEALQFYLLAIQTALLVYVTWKEATA
jgi:hypothetical protein